MALVRVCNLDVVLGIIPDPLVLVIDDHLQPAKHALDPIVARLNVHMYCPNLAHVQASLFSVSERPRTWRSMSLIIRNARSRSLSSVVAFTAAPWLLARVWE